MISDALPRITVMVAASRIWRAARVRKVVAPAPTGSSTTGRSSVLALRAVLIMVATQSLVRVPMLSTSARARETISSTSSVLCAITGEAPAASSALAVTFMTTRLVML
jgi:hypothetical protein